MIYFAESVKQVDEIQMKDEHLPDDPWIDSSAVERIERLQSSAELNSLQRQNRLNDTLFIGMFRSKNK